ncbi:MAG TPA: type II toxin-antitoxin system RelE/ParE family toxin [Stellaceae bacterium]|nr:type II toxin-antitoxin system RelE/ParE family toxin [Stellaceae bacterium]
MNVEYARRAVSDIRTIAAYYARSDNPQLCERVASRIRDVVARISRRPESGRPVAARPGVRVVPLIRYPFNLFYLVGDHGVRVLHIRHTARRPWTGG